jgi:tRNA(fMet)-specific endonuclease VapC
MAMIAMLDTDILAYSANRRPGFERVARRMSGRSPGEVRISAITLAELKFGIEKGELRMENRAALDGILEFIQVDDFPAGAADDFAEIKIALLADGRPIGPYDLLIAAHARHIGAVLVTNNEREFRRVPRLAVQNWLRP